MKRTLTLLGLAVASAFSVTNSPAIELSLEENRAERGSVGFVDMQRLFKASPDAARAREGLEELVRQAEEQVNAKKAEFLRLRQDLATLKIEREELAKAPPPLAPAPAPAASTQTAPAPAPIKLPGLNEIPPSPPPAAAPAAPAAPTPAERLLELDGRVSAKQSELDRLQGELDRERLGAERTLLDAEGRKTDQVFARLYRAIAEVAKREGVSVVVDKSATLYGHPAVDLTDKILKQLRGAAPAQ